MNDEVLKPFEFIDPEKADETLKNAKFYLSDQYDKKSCFLCGHRFHPLNGTARGIVVDDQDENSNPVLYIEWFDVCHDCAKRFDRIWRDYDLEDE